MRYIIEIVHRIFQGTKSLAPTDRTDPDNKIIVYQPISANVCFILLW